MNRTDFYRGRWFGVVRGGVGVAQNRGRIAYIVMVDDDDPNARADGDRHAVYDDGFG